MGKKILADIVGADGALLIEFYAMDVDDDESTVETLTDLGFGSLSNWCPRYSTDQPLLPFGTSTHKMAWMGVDEIFANDLAFSSP